MKESFYSLVNCTKATVIVALFTVGGFDALIGGIMPPAFAAPVDAAPVAQDGRILTGEVTRLLMLDELVSVMSQEAVAQASEDLGAIPPDQQTAWRANIARINDPDRLSRLMAIELPVALGRVDPAQIRKALLFYHTDLGKRVVQLELSARLAMIAPDARDAAMEAAEQAAETGNLRLERIDRIMAVTDVVDANVAGSLNAIIASSRGFADVSEIEVPVEDMTSEAWAQEPEIRDNITRWVQAMLYLAYSPLSEAELEDLTTFVGSREASALADALGAAFDGIFARIAYETGVMSAGQLAEADL